MHVDTQRDEFNDSDINMLQPSPQRMSSRRHQHVENKYKNMILGNKYEDGDATPVDPNLKRSGSMTNKTTQAAILNRKGIEENKARVKTLLDNIKNHQHCYILNQTLDPSNQAHEQFKGSYKTLQMIDIDYDIGKFTNSNEIKTELL